MEFGGEGVEYQTYFNSEMLHFVEIELSSNWMTS